VLLGVLVAAGLGIWVAWVGGTMVGVVFGDVIGDPNRLGLDAAFPALFMALLAPQLHGRAPRIAALAGATIGLILTPLTPAGVPIVLAGLGALAGARAKGSS